MKRFDIDAEYLRRIEAEARKLGHRLGDSMPKELGLGWALILFAFDGPEATYISNAQRDDMVKMLRETADMIEQNKTMPTLPGAGKTGNA